MSLTVLIQLAAVASGLAATRMGWQRHGRCQADWLAMSMLSAGAYLASVPPG